MMSYVKYNFRCMLVAFISLPISPIVALAATVFAPFFINTAATVADLYVNPVGNDACNGTSPALGTSGNCAVATLNHARTLAATLIAGNAARGYNINLATGNYF